MKKTILMSLATMFAFAFISLQVKAVPDNKAAVQKVYAAPNALPPLLITTTCVTDDVIQWNSAKPADDQWNNINISQVTTTGVNTVVNNQASDKPSGKKAIMQWQKKNGLHPDGIWGPACKAKDAANKTNKAVAITDKDTGQQVYKDNELNIPDVSGADSDTPWKDVAYNQLK